MIIYAHLLISFKCIDFYTFFSHSQVLFSLHLTFFRFRCSSFHTFSPVIIKAEQPIRCRSFCPPWLNMRFRVNQSLGLCTLFAAVLRLTGKNVASKSERIKKESDKTGKLVPSFFLSFSLFLCRFYPSVR